MRSPLPDKERTRAQALIDMLQERIAKDKEGRTFPDVDPNIELDFTHNRMDDVLRLLDLHSEALSLLLEERRDPQAWLHPTGKRPPWV